MRAVYRNVIITDYLCLELDDMNVAKDIWFQQDGNQRPYQLMQQ